ncbi:MAG: hypothetical protein AAGF15_06265 [Pseudomonadota bacterium]
MRILRHWAILVAMGGLVAGCGEFRGIGWPRLGPINPAPEDVDDDVMEDAVRRAEDPEAAMAALGQIRNDLAKSETRFVGLRQRLEEQKALYINSRRDLSPADRRGSPQWNAAQIELTRLGRVISELEALRLTLGGSSATMARLAKEDVSVSDEFEAAGTIVAAIDRLLTREQAFVAEESETLAAR